MDGVAVTPAVSGADEAERVAFAQLFTREPLDHPVTRADIVARLADLVPGAGAALRRATLGRTDRGPSVSGDLLGSSDDGRVQAAVHPVLHPGDLHAVVSLECPLDRVDLPELVGVVRSLGERILADLGQVTVLGPEDGVVPTMYLTPRDLRRWLPEVWHGLLLGPPYVELVGRDRIRGAPAHAVEPNGAGTWIQLAPWAEVADGSGDGGHGRRRDEVRDHLGEDLFWHPERRVYRTPDFGTAPASPAVPGTGRAAR